jgi:hypothetical protein
LEKKSPRSGRIRRRGKMVDFWNWIKSHDDVPNWVILLFSLFVWPGVLYWWSSRKIQSIPHLEVQPQGGNMGIANHPYNAVYLNFTNRTGSVVYLSHARLRGHPDSFPIPPAAVKGLSAGWYELKFDTSNTGNLNQDECILQTNARVGTGIAVGRPMDQAFYSHRPGFLRRFFRTPKYFLLQYTAMVGDKKYSVQTVY